MPKRKELAEREREQIQEALALDQASVNLVRKVWNLARGRKPEAHRNAFYDCANEVFRQSKDCYTALRVEEGCIVLANLDKVLARVAETSSAWRAALAEAAAHRELSLILYHDEAMCGNVLAHRKDKKACFIYLVVRFYLWHLQLS